MSDWSELKRLAELCPWEKIEGFEYDASAGKAFCLGDGPHNHLITTFDQRFQKYIEASSPAAVLALIAENERLDGECEGCPMSITEELRKERDQLMAENEALRKDADRYIWLRDEADTADFEVLCLTALDEWSAYIDASMSQGEKAGD